MGRRFLTSVEREAFDILKPLAKKYDYQIFAKVRFADVVNLDGVRGKEKNYALKAHLDLVLVSNNFVSFAIEVDGPDHFMDLEAPARDLKKNALCERLGLDLLRIDKNYFHKLKSHTVLSVLAEEIMFRRRQKTSNTSFKPSSLKDSTMLERESQSILNRVKKFENKLYTFRTQENDFHYTANILEHREDKYVVGQGCAHISNVLQAKPERLADHLSLLDLNRRLNLPLNQIDPALPKTLAAEIRSNYESASEFPAVRMQMLKYTGQECFPTPIS